MDLCYDSSSFADRTSNALNGPRTHVANGEDARDRRTEGKAGFEPVGGEFPKSTG